MGAYTIGWLNNNKYIIDQPVLRSRRRGLGGRRQLRGNARRLHGRVPRRQQQRDHRWLGYVKFDEVGHRQLLRCTRDTCELGDGDLEFLHLSSCFSMDREDWWNEWNSSFDGLHQVDGFHGIMWIDADYTRRTTGVSRTTAFWMSIADSWLDHLYTVSVVRAGPVPRSASASGPTTTTVGTG